MRAVNDQTRELIEELGAGEGGFDATWVADLMYDGERRLHDVPFTAPSFAWDMGRFVEGSGQVTVVWSDDFGSSMIPRQIGDWFSPFGAELQVDLMIRAGRYVDRVPMGRFIIEDVPHAEDRKLLFQGRHISPGQSFTLQLADRLEKVNQDEFRVPSRARSTSAWAEIQSITGFPVIRNVPDAAVPGSLTYEGDKATVLNQLFDAIGAWPHLTPSGVLTALPKTWPDPVDELRALVSHPVSMSRAQTYNSVVVEGKTADGDPIYALADVTTGFLRVRNSDGGESPFGEKPRRYFNPIFDTYEKCAAYAGELVQRVSRLRGVTQTVVEPFNPLREIGDVLNGPEGLRRVQAIRHGRATTELVLEVPDE